MVKKDPVVESEEIVDAEEVSDLAIPNEGQSLLPASSAWDQANEFDTIEGFDLEKDKLELVGIPFIVTAVTFRPGAYKRPGELLPSDYVSVELVTATPDIYAAKVLKNRARYLTMGVPTDSEIGPDESVVINDASTGIKRQIVWYLHSRGFIKVAEDLPQDYNDLKGEMGKNPLDVNADLWASGWEPDKDTRFELRLLCKRGLRPSKYENEHTPDGMTFYLA